MSTVLKPWLLQLPWKQQSTLLAATRGPDSHRPPSIKALGRWMRTVTQKNADETTSFMKGTRLPKKEAVLEEVEYCMVHYFTHLLHALEIIGYKHPNTKDRNKARFLYEFLVCALHLNVETEEQIDQRLPRQPREDNLTGPTMNRSRRVDFS